MPPSAPCTYLRIAQRAGGVGLVALNVQADGGADAASAAQAEDQPRAVLEDDAQALLLGHGAVDGVRVRKVVHERHGERLLPAREGLADEFPGRRLRTQPGHQVLGAVAGHFLVVVSGAEKRM